MADVVPVDVTVSSPAQVVCVDLVRSVNSDRIRTDQKSIRVKFDARLVSVVVEAYLGVVSGKDEVVSVVVHDQRVLVSIVKGVQQAIGVLFGLVEPNHVVLILVTQSIAEESNGAIEIGRAHV